MKFFFMKYLLFLPLMLSFIAITAQQPTRAYQRSLKTFLNPHSTHIMVVAHRGVHNEVPENSIASFKKAIALGIDMVEMDIRHTKDSVLVLMHDKTVNRTTNGKGLVSDFTFEEIKKLRLTHKGRLTAETVPSFEEAISQLNGKILIDLDVKTPLTSMVVKIVEKHNAHRSVLFLIYDTAWALELKKRNPFFMSMVRTYSPQHADSVLNRLHTEAIHIDDSQNSYEVISNIKKHNSRVFINSLGNIDQQAADGNLPSFETVLQHGANMIQTDEPALLLQYLRQTKRHQ